MRFWRIRKSTGGSRCKPSPRRASLPWWTRGLCATSRAVDREHRAAGHPRRHPFTGIRETHLLVEAFGGCIRDDPQLRPVVFACQPKDMLTRLPPDAFADEVW